MNIAKTPNSISLDIREMADKPKYEKVETISNRLLNELEDKIQKRLIGQGMNKKPKLDEKKLLKMFKISVSHLLNNSDIKSIKAELKAKESGDYINFNVLSESEFNNEILGKINIAYRASSKLKRMQLA